MAQLFSSMKGQSAGLVSGSVAGMEGSTSLRRVGSMRRTFMSGQAGLKKKSICLQVKFNVVSYKFYIFFCTVICILKA